MLTSCRLGCLLFIIVFSWHLYWDSVSCCWEKTKDERLLGGFQSFGGSGPFQKIFNFGLARRQRVRQGPQSFQRGAQIEPKRIFPGKVVLLSGERNFCNHLPKPVALPATMPGQATLSNFLCLLRRVALRFFCN